MQITEITIHPTNEDLVKPYATVCFDKATQRNEKSAKMIIARIESRLKIGKNEEAMTVVKVLAILASC
jgi:hypothetical protein